MRIRVMIYISVIIRHEFKNVRLVTWICKNMGSA